MDIIDSVALRGGESRIRPQQSRIKKGDSATDSRSSRYHGVYARWHASCSSSIGIDVPLLAGTRLPVAPALSYRQYFVHQGPEGADELFRPPRHAAACSAKGPSSLTTGCHPRDANGSRCRACARIGAPLRFQVGGWGSSGCAHLGGSLCRAEQLAKQRMVASVPTIPRFA